MKKTSLILLILILGFVAIGQQWTEPIIVSTSDNNICYNPNMNIDTNGIIHIVWEYEYNNFYSKIFYRNSFDNGVSWNEITNISQNNNMSMSDPKVVCNDTFNIFVSYDYNSQVDVYLAEYKDGYWHSPYLVSWGVPGGGVDYLNRLVLDNENRLYVFWWNSNMKYYYKYMENEMWSDMFSPYGDSAEIHFFKDYAVDEDNNLHWVGDSPLESNPMKAKITYYKYNKEQGNWCYPEYVTNNYTHETHYRDIALDSAQNPHFVWSHMRDDPDVGWIHRTMYKSKVNGIWSQQDTVVTDPSWQQQIAIDGQNRVHIILKEKTPDDIWQLLHYRKINNQWVGEIIDEVEFTLGSTKLAYHNNMLFLSYHKSLHQGDPYYVYFTRYDIVTNVEEKLKATTPECKLYPNPFSNKINIEFETKQQGRVWIYVIDMQGNLVKELNNSALPTGKYRFEWAGYDMNSNSVASGSYLIRMVSGNYQLVKTVQLAN